MRMPKFLLATLLCLGLTLFAESAQSQNISTGYTVTPKSGAGLEFEAAWRQHVEWRKQNNDPWSWDTWQVVSGPNLDEYVIRSAGHSWADFDAYEASEFTALADEHFYETVLPFMGSVSNTMSATDTSLVHLPADPTAINLADVTTFHLKPDQGEAFNEVMTAFHEAVVQHDSPLYYVVASPVGGSTGPSVTLVVLAEKWADFEEPDPSIFELMVQTYGEERAGELFQQFAGSFTSTENVILRLRRDLSMLDGM
jgi:quinol monooxygenase YgiN